MTSTLWQIYVMAAAAISARPSATVARRRSLRPRSAWAAAALAVVFLLELAAESERRIVQTMLKMMLVATKPSSSAGLHTPTRRPRRL